MQGMNKPSISYNQGVICLYERHSRPHDIVYFIHKKDNFYRETSKSCIAYNLTDGPM